MVLNKITFAAMLCTMVSLSAVHAGEITVRFEEDAPKDRFVISNSSYCSLDNVDLELNLVGSGGRLVFDTAPEGDRIYQSTRVDVKNSSILDLPVIDEGQTALLLSFATIGSQGQAVIEVDVDDLTNAMNDEEVTLTSEAIAGTMISLVDLKGAKMVSQFNENAEAVIEGVTC